MHMPGVSIKIQRYCDTIIAFPKWQILDFSQLKEIVQEAARMPPWSKIDLTHCNTFFPLNDEHWNCTFNVRKQPCALETSFRSIDKINYGNVSVDALATVVCVVVRTRASALQSWGPEFESRERVSTLGFFIGSHIRRECWCSSQEAESREISISCKNLFLNQCIINMFKLSYCGVTKTHFVNFNFGLFNGYTAMIWPYL